MDWAALMTVGERIKEESPRQRGDNAGSSGTISRL